MRLHGTINLRSSRRGAGVVRKTSDAVTMPMLRDRVILLVHGFATNPEQAIAEYSSFAYNVGALSLYGRMPGNTSIIGVLWPGNDGNWVIDKASFASRVDAAERAGERLAELVRDTPIKQIAIVGHSLGCRLVLEFLAQRIGQDGPATVLALLMAAAVPEDHCAAGGLFERELLEAARQVVLHSRRDLVLWGAFRPGMRLARAGWSRPVGRDGGPDQRWDDLEDVSLGHGEYWGAEITADRLAAYLGISQSRRVQARRPSGRTVSPRLTSERAVATRRAARRVT